MNEFLYERLCIVLFGSCWGRVSCIANAFWVVCFVVDGRPASAAIGNISWKATRINGGNCIHSLDIWMRLIRVRYRPVHALLSRPE